MAAKSASSSSLPWIWVIETLASVKKVDASLLIDLVKRTPEISDDVGKNAREMVSFRILESMFVQGSGITDGAVSAPDSEIGFDPSEQCEDVLRRILPELKDAILQDSHLLPASLKERSGLEVKDLFDDSMLVNVGDSAGTPRLEGCNIERNGQSPDRDLLPAKRDRNGTILENVDGQSHEDQEIMESCDPLSNAAKKLKLDAICTGEAVSQHLTSLHGTELVQGSSDRILQHTGREGCDFAKEPQVGCLEERLGGQSSDVYDPAFLHNKEQVPCNGDKVPPEATFVEVEGEIIGVDETGKDAEGCTEQRTVIDAPLGAPRQKDFLDEAKDNPEHNLQPNASSGVSTGEAKDDVEHNREAKMSRDTDGYHDETAIVTKNNSQKVVLGLQNQSVNKATDNVDHSSQPDAPIVSPTVETKDDMGRNSELEMSSDSDGYDDERTDIDTKKHAFLSSQCTYSQDSLAATDCCTELNLCMKCNKDGSLLACSSDACPLVVHESCLDSAATYDVKGNFFCPFCAYSRAIVDYLDFKKMASLARKDLATFISLGAENRPKKFSKRFHESENRRRGKNLAKNDETNSEENCLNKDNSNQCGADKKNSKQAEPSLSCFNDPPCTEIGATVSDGNRCALKEDRRKEQKRGEGCGSPSGPEEQQNAVHNCEADNSTCRDTEKVHGSEKHAETEIQQHRSGLLHRPACSPSTDAEGSSEEENDKSITSKYSIRFRKQERQYTYPAIPQLRRKKLPWTREEEEKLKEGFQMYSSLNEKSIPWKNILDYGEKVFQKGRTPMDLKDKWRNICKGSPKL
ncbi:hypothetical protein RJ640_010747 [Escallonia rubra]|uniref:Myb-like domain-containing protein n=1 Tax=Escallonia rubra TaxID=112253 RepID=A0AA88SAR6_9ASTE|nr:hypothetical protein RJ640_010747 [Escallonia rubra]